jgi:hypothetical protein
MNMDSKDLYNKAYNAHYDSGNIDEAGHLYRQVIDQFPKSEEAGYARTQLKNIATGPKIKVNTKDLLETVAATTEVTFNNQPQPTSSPNEIARWIGIVAYVQMGVGLLLGFILGNQGSDFSWVSALPWVVVGLVSGLMLLILSEIIRLLHEINERGKRM